MSVLSTGLTYIISRDMKRHNVSSLELMMKISKCGVEIYDFDGKATITKKVVNRDVMTETYATNSFIEFLGLRFKHLLGCRFDFTSIYRQILDNIKSPELTIELTISRNATGKLDFSSNFTMSSMVKGSARPLTYFYQGWSLENCLSIAKTVLIDTLPKNCN